MITVPTIHIYNIKKTVTIISKNINNVKDKWCGDYYHDIEKENLKYIRRNLKL